MGGAPGGMPRMSQLRQEIAESEHATEMAQENFEKMSRMIKKEVRVAVALRTTTFFASKCEASVHCWSGPSVKLALHPLVRIL